jgi:hypothetical protein
MQRSHRRDEHTVLLFLHSELHDNVIKVYKKLSASPQLQALRQQTPVVAAAAAVKIAVVCYKSGTQVQQKHLHSAAVLAKQQQWCILTTMTACRP